MIYIQMHSPYRALMHCYVMCSKEEEIPSVSSGSNKFLISPNSMAAFITWINSVPVQVLTTVENTHKNMQLHKLPYMYECLCTHPNNVAHKMMP